MKFLNILEYFLLISICILLLYNFTTTVLFPLKKELFVATNRIRRLQQVFLIVILIGMIVYIFYTETITIEKSYMLMISWIWGFLASHIFISKNRYWFSELLGLGMLIAISIVLFFKQNDLLLYIEKNLFAISYWIYIVYAGLGLVLGRLLWPGIKEVKDN